MDSDRTLVLFLDDVVWDNSEVGEPENDTVVQQKGEYKMVELVNTPPFMPAMIIIEGPDGFREALPQSRDGRAYWRFASSLEVLAEQA